MKQMATVLLLATTAISLVASSGDGQCANGLTVRVAQVHGKREVAIELVNHTSRAVSLRSDQLPWEWRYAMVMKAVKTDSVGTLLGEDYGISDPVPRTVIVKAGDSIRGSVDLDLRFPGLEEALKVTDVLLLWSYVPVVDGRSQSRSAGVLILHRTN